MKHPVLEFPMKNLILLCTLLLGILLKFIKDTDGDSNSLVDKTLEFVKRFSGIESAQKSLAQHSRMAIEALDNLNDSEYKKELETLALYVGNRVV